MSAHCSRRRVLLLGGTAMVGVLAGCGDQERPIGSPDETATSSPAPTETATSSPTLTETTTSCSTASGDTTSENRTIPAAEHTYVFGEPHSLNELEVTITEVVILTTFQTDEDDKRYEMPADEQLVIATMEVTNTVARTRSWSKRFTLLYEGRAYEDETGFSHPAFPNGVGMDELRRVPHMLQWYTEGLVVRPDETREGWNLFVTPRSVTCQHLQIGFEVNVDDVLYPIRWIPP